PKVWGEAVMPLRRAQARPLRLRRGKYRVPIGRQAQAFPCVSGTLFPATSFEEEGMHKLFAVALGLISVVLCGGALAQQYPTKPVKLIVTYPPGGSSDLLARVFGQKLSEIWGQPVIVERKPGAAGPNR